MPLSPKEAGGARTPKAFPHDIPFSALFDGASDRLSFTPIVAGDRRTWTCRCCTKTVRDPFYFLNVNSQLQFYLNSTGHLTLVTAIPSTANVLVTSDVFIDPSAHYDIVLAVDTTQAVASDRVKLYVNGQPITDFSTANYPALNQEWAVNSTIAHEIGGTFSGSQYISDFYFIDGQALPASTFGEFSDQLTGLWVSKNPGSLAYGTNGSHLDFSNAVDLGADVSGNGNHWTVHGSPVQTVDTPTDNHCVWNALENNGYNNLPTLNNGNLDAAHNGSSNVCGTLCPTSSKWVFEAVWTGSATGGASAIGVALRGQTTTHNVVNLALYNTDGTVNNVSGAAGTALTSGDRVRVEFDVDAWAIEFFVNNVSQGGVRTLSVVNDGDGLSPFCNMIASKNDAWSANFGQFGFVDTPTTGFNALSSANLPDPVVMRSASAAQVILRIGTGAAASIQVDSAMAGGPDFVNQKIRQPNAYSWILSDSIRGSNKQLLTDSTAAEQTSTNQLTAFNSDGYDLGSDSTVNVLNGSFVDLCLKAGVDHGFEIVTYTGDGVSGRTVSHSLGKAPTFMLVKARTMTTGNNGYWIVYHTGLGATKAVFLNDASAAVTSSTYWNDVAPTSTNFTLGNAWNVNKSGDTYVAYLFTDSDIFKAFSYTGNGSADGPFVNLGGRPLSVPFIKNSGSSIRQWLCLDSVRDPFNPIEQELYPATSDSELGGFPKLNFTSQGVKAIAGTDVLNGSGNLHVGLAILESTKYSNAY